MMGKSHSIELLAPAHDYDGGVPRLQMRIGGSWTAAFVENWMAVENPATEEVIAFVPEGGVEHADQALAAARDAQADWQALTAGARAALLHALADLADAHKERLGRIITAEQGKPLREAIGEAGAIGLYLRYAAEAALRIEGDILPSDRAGEEIWIRRVPYGAVAALTAWNYPAGLAARKLGPALVTGNTIVLKPHELTPLTALEIAYLAEQAGFPPGVVNIVTGQGRTIGERLVTSDQSDLVTMTGSLRAGREIFAAGASQIKPLRLELGGKAPFVVLEDADIENAVEAAVVSRFTNCGQICTCNERMYLHRDIAPAFVEKFIARARALRVGDPMTDPDMGPKISADERDKVEAIVQSAVSGGAEVLLGGERPSGGAFDKGYWMTPTILGSIAEDSPLLRDEIFGPVVPIVEVTSFEEAMTLANASHFGLSAYVFTRQLDRIMRLQSELKFGEIYINRPCGDLPHAFHNGWRQSGIGGEDGRYGIEGYLRKQTSYVNWS